MNWFLSHLLHILIAGLGLIILSVLRIGLRWPKHSLRRLCFWLGLGLFIVALIGIIFTFTTSPGLEDTVDVDEHRRPQPEPGSLLESLCQSWDSTAHPSWRIAELLALASEKAYLTPFEAQASYGELGFDKDDVKTFQYGSMIGYVISLNDATIIAFRGTDDITDWLVDLNVIPSEVPPGMVHKGIYDSYRRLKPRIIDLLERKPKHLWITGHSLGGALALICAYDLVEKEKYHLDGVITFGQPMVADSEFAEYLDDLLYGRYVHYVNDDDIVPRAVPGYAHCGTLVWFKDGGVKQSIPEHRVVGVARAKKAIPIKANVLSDVEFKRMKTELQRSPVKKSMKIGLVGAADAKKVTLIGKNEFVPFSKQQFNQVKADLREEKITPKRRPDGKMLVKGKTPWLRDHSMTHYLEKIQDWLGKTVK